MDKKYDVGIMGVWPGCNYGSIMTYYALNNAVKSLGYSVVMIDKPLPASGKDIEFEETHSRRFAKEHYDIAPAYQLKDFNKYNDLCDNFLLGSDQLWNYGISKNFGKAFYFDFVNDDKRKIAYSTSFGHGIDFAPENERKVISSYMKRFNAISVREKDGVSICNDIYGVAAERVTDPVFMVDPEKVYRPLIEKSTCHEKEPFIAAYILDPTPEKREALLHISKKLGGIKIINLLDGLFWLFEDNKKKMNLDNCIENLQVEDWLYYLSNSQFVVTDSCHGASFAMIFKKNFIAITNKRRGFSRFKSLSDVFNFTDRLVTDVERIKRDDSLLTPINYEMIDDIMKKEKEKGIEWLKNALEAPVSQKVAETEIKPVNDTFSKPPVISFDLARCKMLATLLKQYGIDHVVMSSGSRDLNLVRIFEADPYFKTYSVIDERSAGFFALGLALKLKRTVAMCCTSGTASSNYLTSITEAYYQHVPLVVITTDRYPCFLGQNEDQTIPQINMYGSVVKKSVTLPVTDGPMGEWEARRLICEAILEVNRHGTGPVHINIPINQIDRAKPTDPRVLKLDKKFRTIERVTVEDSDEVWKARVERLKKMNRIFVLYGQNHPLSIEEQRSVEAFAEKFNCIIATDNYSNFRCANSIATTPIFKNLDGNTYNNKLWADIVITVNGRRAFNDPTLPNFRTQKKPLAHWRVAEDGEIADTYRKLSRVFECSPKYFFDKFVKFAGDIENNHEYLNLWKEEQAKVPSPHTDNYSMRYAIERLVTNLPDYSLLHLGLGSTVSTANMFKINPTVNIFANLGTNGIDGPGSTFMGQVAVSDEPCFLVLSDLSFFYDMNSIWSKKLKGNVRIMLCNNNGSGLLRHHQSPSITHVHNTSAKGWVKSLGFEYLSSHNAEEFDQNLKVFLSDTGKPMFFEVFC